MADAGLGEFFRQLEYKCTCRVGEVSDGRKVGALEPCSQRCSSSGKINAELTLAADTGQRAFFTDKPEHIRESLSGM